jgi:hypothetical protein
MPGDIGVNIPTGQQTSGQIGRFVSAPGSRGASNDAILSPKPSEAPAER